jgi:PAS domain S-box-containing protein
MAGGEQVLAGAAFEALFEHLRVAAAILDEDLRLIRANPRFRELAGEGAVRGAMLEEAAPGLGTQLGSLARRAWERDAAVQEIVERPQPEGTGVASFAAECRPLRTDGGRALLLQLEDERGTPLQLAGRSDAAHRLREQQHFLDAIVENLPNMIFVKEAAELRFVRFNRAGEELLGYTRDQLLGKNDYDFFPANEADHFTSQDRAVLASKAVIESPEEPIHTRDKGVRILRTKKVPILDEQGLPQYLLGISEDITERHRIEAFRLSDLLVRSIEDYAIFLVDQAGLVKTWNAGAERVTGYAADEIIGQPLGALWGRPAAAQGHFADEGHWARKDGQRIWRVTTVTAIRDEDGSVVLYGVVTRDITERKRAEDEREHLLARLREALRLRDEFLSVASHELRTPVTTLTLQAELLRRFVQTPAEASVSRLPPIVDKLKKQTVRLEEHVTRLLDVSRLSSGKVQLQPTDVDLAEVASAVVARFTEDADDVAVIQLRGAPSVLGHWDALRLDQVITNLVSNAIKYGGGQPVEVTVEDEDGHARLEVRDHGIGIAREDQARIFEQFERAVSERNYGGFGLGLFIVRQLVEAMEGRVEVESELGAGARFVVTLPYGRRGEDPGHRR